MGKWGVWLKNGSLSLNECWIMTNLNPFMNAESKCPQCVCKCLEKSENNIHFYVKSLQYY